MMPNKNIKVNVLHFQNKGMQLLQKPKYIPAFLTDQQTFGGEGGAAALTTGIPKDTAEIT